MTPDTTHDLLAEIVDQAEYRPGYRLFLADHDGVLCFQVLSIGYDSYHPETGPNYRVVHSFQVPPATYNRQSWLRWILDRLIDIETHEACEFFKLRADSEPPKNGDETVHYERPFAPNHGPGWDPYGVRELNRVEDAETTFRGERREGTQELRII